MNWEFNFHLLRLFQNLTGFGTSSLTHRQYGWHSESKFGLLNTRCSVLSLCMPVSSKMFLELTKRREAVPQLRRLVHGFPPRRPDFDPRSIHTGFVVDEVVLGQVFSEYFGLAWKLPFHQILHTHPSCGTGTKGQLMADVPSGLSLTPPHKLERKLLKSFPHSCGASIKLDPSCL
jgi:hypothetical protein